MPSEKIRLWGSTLPGVMPMVSCSSRTFPRHTHDVFGIGVIDQGGQRSASGRGAVEAVRGDVITVNPGEVHDGVAMRGEPRVWRMLYLEPDLLAGLVPQREFIRPVLSDPALCQTFDRLFCIAAQRGEALAAACLAAAVPRGAGPALDRAG